jgi:putative drug exporter of the RND superfamily
MFARIGHFVVRHPWKIIVAWVAVAALVVALSPPIDDVVNQDDKSFVPDSYESSKASAAEAQAFPDSKDGSSLIVFKRSDGGKLTAADHQRIASTVRELNAEHVRHVDGVATNRRLISPKGDTQLAAIKFTKRDVDDEAQNAVVELRAAAAKDLNGSAVVAGITGGAAIQHDLHEGIHEAEGVVGIATVVLIILLTGLIFRSPVAAFFPILSVGLVSAMAKGLIADSAKLFGYECDFTLPVLLTVVLFGIGTDYILFILFRFRERLRAGDSPQDAVAFSVARVGEAVASSALVVVAAFCALVLSTLESNQTLGPSLAIAVVVMLAAGLTLIPAALALLGSRVFWPSKAWMTAPQGKFGRKVADRTVKHPVAIAITALALLCALGYGMTQFGSSYDQMSAIKSDKEASTAYDDLKQSFPPGAIDPTKVVVTSKDKLAKADLAPLVNDLKQVKGVGSVAPPEISKAGNTARMQVLLDMNPTSTEALDLAGGPLRTVAHASHAGDQVLVGGTSSANADLRDGTNSDRSIVYPVAALLIAVILAILLRSAVAPLPLLLSVGLGYLATLGASVIAFQVIGGEDGLSFKVPTLVYLFVVAIGTDYNILLTSRVREEVAEGKSTREAIRTALMTAGPTVGAAAAILAGTFASLMITGVSSFAQIGFAVSTGIVLSAFVLALRLVPSISVVLGERVWWPSRPAAKKRAERPAPLATGEPAFEARKAA